MDACPIVAFLPLRNLATKISLDSFARGLLSLVVIGIVAFAGTNIDDIFLLVTFYSSNTPSRQVVVRQYLGIGLLVAISTIGVLLAFVLPQHIIGAMGLAPLAIGTRRLFEVTKAPK